MDTDIQISREGYREREMKRGIQREMKRGIHRER